MYAHVVPLQNICPITYFQIKILVCVDEAENILHAFLFVYCFLWVSLSMFMVFLISALYYASNMLEIVESK